MLRREYNDHEVVGMHLPWYWGMSYQKLLTARVVYHVIPLNLFVRWGRDFLFWLGTAGVRGYRQRTENALYLRGLQAGQANIRSRILCQVASNLMAQGMPAENANAWAEHVLKATCEYDRGRKGISPSCAPRAHHHGSTAQDSGSHGALLA